MSSALIVVDKIVEYIVGKVFQPVERHVGFLFHYKQNVKNLEDEKNHLQQQRSNIQENVNQAEHRGEAIDNNVSVWLQDADEARQGVEMFMNEKTVKENMRCFNFSCPDFTWRYRLSKQAETKVVCLKHLFENGSKFGTVSHPREDPPELQLPSSRDYEDFRSRERVLQGIVEALKDPEVNMIGVYGTGGVYEDFRSRERVLQGIVEALKDPEVNMIGVYGTGGVGKTTMVEKVGKLLKEEGTFDEVVTAVVSHNANVIRIQGQLADRLNLTFSAETEVGRGNQLWKRLDNGKKNLIILDDVWHELDLMDIGIPTQDGNKRCKVVLTSRSRDVWKNMDVHKDFHVEFLSEEEGWNLFKKKVGNYVDSHDQLLSDIAWAVCKGCQGLPVAINALGAALKDRDIYAWKDAHVKLKNSLLKDVEGINPTLYASLKLSYDLLDSEAVKSCFLLCCLFPEDYEIPIDDLVRYYISGKTLRYQKMPDTLEKAFFQVHTMVDTLKRSCLLLDGKYEHIVKVHDVVRDVGISIAEDEKSFLVRQGVGYWPKKATYKDCSVISLMPHDLSEFPNELDCPELHTLRLDCTINKFQLQVPDGFFSGMEKLLVLDLKGVIMFPLLPTSFKKFAELQMLCLDRCKLGDIAILKDLKDHLEILSLRGSNIEVLPPEVGELACLRLLDMSYCDELGMIPKGVISKLLRLEELYMPQNFHQWEGTSAKREICSVSLDELMLLTRLTTLHIYIRDPALLPKDNFFFENLVRFRITVGGASSCNDPVPTGVLRLENVHVANALEYLLGKRKHERSIEKNGLYPSTSFKHLGELCVTDCRLKNLFSPSSVRGLVRLKKLEIKRCTVMEGVIGTEGEKDEDIMINFNGLDDLNLEDLPILISFYPKKEKTAAHSESSSTRAQTVLFNDKVAFRALEHLQISNLPTITDIWDKKICSAQSFCPLRDLSVYNCGKLVNVVPSNMLPKLQNLERLTVYSCPMVEGIVDLEKKEEETQEAANNTFVPFPELRYMKLGGLQNVKGFCAFRSEEQCVFNVQVAFPKLDRLYVHAFGERALRQLTDASELSLKYLEFCKCDEVSTVVSPHLLRSLRLVEDLSVISCRGAREVFHFDEQEVGEGQVCVGLLTQVCILDLYNLPQLTCLWNKDPHRLLVLQSLEYLIITNCPILANLLTASVAKALGGLKELHLRSCSTIEEVIAIDEGHANVIDDDEIEFPKLEQLTLQDLSNLKSFCSSNHNLNFPSLKQVILERCPKLQAFTSGSVRMSLTFYTTKRNNRLVIEDLNKHLEQQHLKGEETILEDGIYGGDEQQIEDFRYKIEMSTTAPEGQSQQQQVPPTPLDSQHPSTMKMSTIAIEGASQSQQQVPPTPLKSQQGSFFEIVEMPTPATEEAPQSQQQVPPTPLDSQHPSTMKMPTPATEGAPQSQQQVPPTALDSQHPSTMKMPTTAIEGASQSQQQVPPTPLDSQHPSTLKMSTTGTEGAPQMKDILLGKIKDYVVSPIGRQFTYMFDFNNNIEKLETELEELQTTQDLVRRGVNEGRRPQLRVSGLDAVAWLTRANEVTNQVEGIVTDKAKVKEGCLNGFCPNIKLRYSVSRKAVKNTRVVVDLEAAGFDYVKSAYRMPQVENFRAFKSQRLNMEEISEQNFKALKSQMLYMEEIIKALKHDQIDLVGISGMAGVGKTTMAKEVAKRAKENKLFDEVAMAMVGQYPNLSEVQASIADMLGLKLGDLENPIATLLRQRLLQDNKKILVILEDIRAEFDLHTIGIPLGGANKNVKILYTSVVQDLWRDLQTKKEIPLEFLSDDEAWQLFREKAGDLAADQDLQPIAKQIVNECRGLPIALVLIGNILFKRSKGIFIKQMWEDVLKELTCSRSIPAEKRLSSTLELGYNYIEDEEARHLFLLCCFFEEEKSIHIEDLVRYAWGLSLFPRVNTMRKVRQQVSALIDDLKRRYLLLDGENDKCVEVHDVVRDMGIYVASKDKGVLVCHGAASEWPKKYTYEHYTYLSVISDRIAELPERWMCPNLEFLLLECCKVEKLPSNFFEGMKKLKVLGLNNFDGILTLQSLRNLRTLSLKRFGGVLDNVSVMGGLANLEILNFHGSSIKELPEEIGDLVRLRLLDLGDTWSLEKIPPGVISRLVRLEELYIFDSKFREWEGEGKEGEGRNANLREFESLSNLNTLEIRIRCDVLIPEVPIFSKLTTYKVLIGDAGGCCQHIDQYKTKLIVSASSPIPLDRGWFDLLLRSTDCLILEGEGCKDMVKELLLRDGVDGLQQLKYLQISHCDTPECLAKATNLVQLPNEPAPAVFPILEQLKLSALPNLREICRGPAPAGSFGELTDIYVDNCGRLGNLFQLPIVQSLTQLKSLSIMRCDMMEEVIWEEQREDVLAVTNIIDFPKLETLVLDNLPSLMGFGREIKGIDFPHAKCLRLRHLRHLQCLFTNNHGFLSLFPQKVTFPSLELLELQGLENLCDLWGSELLDFSFSKLKELDVEDCGSLRDLFHPSMTGGLVNLQKLVVKNCQKMNAVVGREEEIEEGQGRTTERTLFPQLIVLELDRLPNLRRFCYFTHPVESQLRRIYISDCPSMDTFSLGNVSTPNLSLPGISWNGDLNNTIKLLQEDKGQRDMQFKRREQRGKTILPMDTFMEKRLSFLGSTSKNAAHELNIITNSSFAHDTEGWFSVHKCSLSVHKTSQLPDHFPMPRDSEGKIRYILATERRESREGPAQWITDKLQLFVTYKVSAWVRIGSRVNEPQIATIAFIIDSKDYFDVVQAEVNGDEWHEIVGSFRIESEPDQVMVYVHGFDSGVDLMLAGLQISPVDRRARFEELKKKTDEVRKRDVILQFSGSGSGRPGTFVNVEQKQNSFPIGSCMDRGDLSNKDLVNFFVENFNWAVFQYQLTWDWTESEQGRFYYRGADDLLAFCLDHNIKMRGPCILENRDIPPWVRELEGHDLAKAILKRLNDLLTRYKWMFQHYDVSNEMLHETYFRDKLGNDICVTMFKTAKQLDPKTKLFLNDYHVEEGCDARSSPEKYIEHILDLKARGAPVEGVGMQGHVRFPVGEIICSALDKMGKLGLPIWFTEIDVESMNEHVRAEDLEVMLREAFAHPAVEGIMLWGFWEGMYRKNAHLVNKRGDLNAAGRKFLELKKEWMSNGSGSIDDQGRFMFRGFQGSYEVEIGPRKFTFDVPENPKGQSQSPHVVHINL